MIDKHILQNEYENNKGTIEAIIYFYEEKLCEEDIFFGNINNVKFSDCTYILEDTGIGNIKNNMEQTLDDENIKLKGEGIIKFIISDILWFEGQYDKYGRCEIEKGFEYHIEIESIEYFDDKE